MSLSTGTRLGPYEILAPLGTGGMGEVWRARDTRLDRDVALKVIHSRFAADADRLSRFEQEAKAAARLDHPNILVVHDIGSHEGSPYIVSELLEGESLREQLGAALPPKKAVEYALEIARGLSAAHEKGIVHRDLKPENVFVTKDGRVKILDFGVAKLTQPSTSGPLDTEATTAAATEPGVVLGTVGYMSPEQVQGRPLDARSDLFSLGAVLYEMLSGKRPFHRGTAPETLTAILREEPPDLSETNRNIPPELERIVRHCLEKQPDRRFHSALDVVFDLESISGLLGTKPVTPMSAAGVFLHRHRVAVAVATALLIALALGGGWWWKTKGGPGAVGKRLAVLPFENLTGDPEQAYLADGIHESLITDLARLSGFSRVIARPSVIPYAKTTKRLAEIGKELGVDTLVTGSVMRAAAKLKVTAHLINAGSEEQVWSDSFEREPRDILSLQNEIVRSIAQKAKLTLTPAEQTRLANAKPVNPEAYEAYLKGKFNLNKFTPEGFEKGIAYLQQAIEKDPANPLPYAVLALGYSTMGHEAMPDAFEKAKAATAKARALGGDLAELEEAEAEQKLYSDWDFQGAEKAFRRALELNPGLPDAHAHYAWLLQLYGKREEEWAEAKRAVELDPLTPVWSAWLGWQYLGIRSDEAIAWAKKSLELNPDFSWGLWVLGSAYVEQKKFDEAIAVHTKAAAASQSVTWALGYTYALAGRREEALKIAADLEKKPTPMNTWGLALIHTALGDKDAAFRWLEEGFRTRFSWMPWIDEGPSLGGDGFSPLRSDPRFQDLKRRIGIPEKKPAG